MNKVGEQGFTGNPAGRPKGIKDRRSSLRALIGPHLIAIANVQLPKAVAGDSAAAAACAELYRCESPQQHDTAK